MTTDPTTEALRFAHWAPNVSGGLVASTIEQHKSTSFRSAEGLALHSPALVGAR